MEQQLLRSQLEKMREAPFEMFREQAPEAQLSRVHL